jgi:hypothetical protein
MLTQDPGLPALWHPTRINEPREPLRTSEILLEPTLAEALGRLRIAVRHTRCAGLR